jgi:hypothetical protein
LRKINACGVGFSRELRRLGVCESHTTNDRRGEMRSVAIKVAVLVVVVTLSVVAALASSPPAGAIIHEIVGASCSVNGPPEPPGQAGDSNGNSQLRALQASGFITSIQFNPSTGLVEVRFDYTRPNVKYVGSGSNFQIPGTNILLINAPVLSREDFAAFEHCANLNK